VKGYKKEVAKMASLKVVLFQLLGREFLPPFYPLPPVANGFLQA
jgi:hypothetical protein